MVPTVVGYVSNHHSPGTDGKENKQKKLVADVAGSQKTDH